MKHKRRLARTFGAILATALLLSSCGKTSQENGFETYILPKKYLEECDAVGTIETLTYHVESYAVEAKEGLVPGSLYEDKTLYVYLPAGYDPEQLYNILYLLHGSNETQEYWFYTQKTLGTYFRQQMKIDNPHFTANYTKNVIDQLFAKGECEPFIIVTPSYFSTLRGETDYGDSRDDTMFWLDSFEQELRNDIIPLVESTYLTYANGDTSPQGIQASREHRAIAGFSRGSRFITRIALPDMLDAFSYYGNFHGWETLTTQTLRETLENKPDCPILYWYNGHGPKDHMTTEQRTVCQEILAEFGNTFQENVNFASVDKPEAEHLYDSALLDLYNFSHVLFRQQEGEPG